MFPVHSIHASCPRFWLSKKKIFMHRYQKEDHQFPIINLKDEIKHRKFQSESHKSTHMFSRWDFRLVNWYNSPKDIQNKSKQCRTVSQHEQYDIYVNEWWCQIGGQKRNQSRIDSKSKSCLTRDVRSLSCYMNSRHHFFMDIPQQLTRETPHQIQRWSYPIS